jgi:ABC-2 type transport system permease protein
MYEFIIGSIIVGVIKFLIVMTVYLLVGKYLFGVTVPSVWLFMLGIFVLFIFGISIGMLTLGLNILYHENSFAFTWALPDILVLTCGVYYPISIFPQWVQAISSVIPARYGFDILKSSLGLATVNYTMLVITMIVWFALGILVLTHCYHYAKRHGHLGKSG